MLTITAAARPIPATIGTTFGGLWALVGAFALPIAWRWPTAVAAAIVTVLLVIRLWSATEVRTAAGPALFSKTPYRWAVALELIAIAAASSILPRLGARAALMPVVGIIVGLHFIGLWLTTRSERFLAICAGMCGVSVCALFAPQFWGEVALPAAVAGFGNALVLWLGAGRSS